MLLENFSHNSERKLKNWFVDIICNVVSGESKKLDLKSVFTLGPSIKIYAACEVTVGTA